MPNDIYTGKPIANATDEHLLINALGGREVSRALIDVKTNSEFGRTIDCALAEAVLPVRVLLNGESGDGKSPPAYRGAVDAAGTAYSLLPGGKPEIGKPSMSVSEHEGVLRINGVVRSRNELTRLLGRVADKHRLDMGQLQAMGRHVQEASPSLSMNLTFSAESSRCIAKMACNLFARAHPAEFATTGFDEVRKFVLDGEGLASRFVIFNARAVDIAAWHKGLGLLDHLLLVRSVGREVVALVAIYEHIQFAVRLGVLPQDKKVSTAYRVDQIGRTHRIDDPRDTRLQVRSLEKAASKSTAAFFHQVREAVGRTMRVAMKYQEDAFNRELIGAAIQDTWGDADGRPITEEMIEELAGVVAERWVEHLVRQGRLRG